MPSRLAEHAARQNAATSAQGGVPRRRSKSQPRMPSTVGYMVVAGGLSFALFWGIWWLLRDDGDESRWIFAGLSAGFVILIAAAAREVAMRRAWARYTREMELLMGGGEAARPVLAPKPASANRSGMQAQVAALRNLQQRLHELDVAGTTPDAHLEAYRLCEQHLATTEGSLRMPGGAAEMRVALRSGQERVRALQRKHLLAWARGEVMRLTQEAQKRVRLSDKIETAQRALEVLGEALQVYPGEQELRDSSIAVRDFIGSVKVGQWVEMAERAAFRGRYARAVARYRDALFYLSRAEMGEEAREEAATRIQREIEMLRARIRTADESEEPHTGDGHGARRVSSRRRPFDADAEGEEVLG